MACGDRFICSHGPGCNCFQYYVHQCMPPQTGRMDMGNSILEARVKELEDVVARHIAVTEKIQLAIDKILAHLGVK